MNKVRYAIVGCGEHALRGHAIPGRSVPELELVALCDPSETACEKFSKNFLMAGTVNPIQHFRNEDDLLKSSDVDAVVITNPDRFHAGSLLKAVTMGKHALVDKPIAATYEDLRTLREALEIATKKNLVVTSCHPRRFGLPYQWLKTSLPTFTSKFGEVIEVALDFSYRKASKTGLHTGLLIDHVSHEYDYLTHLLGQPDTIEAHKVFDSADRYQVRGLHGNVVFSFTGTRRLTGPNSAYPEWLRVRFDQGHIEINTASGRALVHDHTEWITEVVKVPSTDYEVVFNGIMNNFTASILGNAKPYLQDSDLIANSAIGIYLMRGGIYFHV